MSIWKLINVNQLARISKIKGFVHSFPRLFIHTILSSRFVLLPLQPRHMSCDPWRRRRLKTVDDGFLQSAVTHTKSNE